MAFFGLKVSSSPVAPLDPLSPALHLSSAVLEDTENPATTTLFLVKENKEKFALGVLRGKGQENLTLNLYVDPTTDKFMAEGASKVHLTGYYEPADDEMSVDSEEAAADAAEEAASKNSADKEQLKAIAKKSHLVPTMEDVDDEDLEEEDEEEFSDDEEEIDEESLKQMTAALKKAEDAKKERAAEGEKKKEKVAAGEKTPEPKPTKKSEATEEKKTEEPKPTKKSEEKESKESDLEDMEEEDMDDLSGLEEEEEEEEMDLDEMMALYNECKRRKMNIPADLNETCAELEKQMSQIPSQEKTEEQVPAGGKKGKKQKA